ncbi:MAG TPA: hypothetical protein VN612_14915 [Acidobacteriaceae bacterium]|nr:hypothetical protein [Acidobacteriaceae bacterium]
MGEDAVDSAMPDGTREREAQGGDRETGEAAHLPAPLKLYLGIARWL